MRVGQTHTEEARRKMSLAHQGFKPSPEHRAALSSALRGKPKSPEHRAKAAATKLGNKYWLGRRHSPESITKMRRPHSEERRVNIGAALAGVPCSLAHRIALSDSHFISLTPNGYAVAKFMGSWVPALRLAWTFYHGPIPEGEIICPANGDRLDCAEDNLQAMARGEHTRFHRQGVTNV